MHDQTVLLDRFFCTAARAAVGSDYGAIHTPQVLVDLSDVDLRCSQALQNPVQRAVRIPTVETTKESFPWTKFAGQVSPGRTRSQYPQDAFDDSAPVLPGTPRFRRWWKNVGNQFPLIIRKSMSQHFAALRGKTECFDRT